MRTQLIKRRDEFLRAIEIGDLIVKNSDWLEARKVNHFEYSQTQINYASGSNLKAVSLNGTISNYFIRWNGWVSVECELFWQALEHEGLKFLRKEPLHFALKKGWFYNVHEAIEIRINWDAVIEGKYLESRYSAKEIEFLTNLIKAEELKRVKEIRLALTKKKITFRNILRFGDSMAYLRQCGLIKKYFTFWEIDEVIQIWKDTGPD